MSNENGQTVIGIIADILNLDPGDVSCDTKRTDVEGWDSMQNLNIVLAVEQEFGITLPAEAIAEIDGIETLLDWIQRSTNN